MVTLKPMANTIYLVKYGIGEYSDYSESVYGAYYYRENAEEMAKNFELLSSWFYEQVQNFRSIQNDFIRQYDIDNVSQAPATSYQQYQRTGKRMTGSEWVNYEKHILPGLLKEWNDKWDLRNKTYKEFGDNWWENKKKEVPEELKKYADIYPADCYNCYSVVGFFVEEIEIKDKLWPD